MGNQKSKQITDIVSEVIVNTTINSSKSCSQRSINSQNVTIKSTGNIKIDKLVLDQSAFTTLSCITETTQDATFSSQLATNITNEILADMEWLATGDQKSVIENNIKNIIEVDNLLEDIQTTFQDVMNEQNLSIEADEDGSIIVGSIYLNQAIEASAESIMKSTAVSDITAYLENDVKNDIVQKQTGFDSIVDSIIGFFTSTIGMAILGAVVVLAIAAYVFTSLFGSTTPEERQQYLNQMK